ncbi:MAG: antitoxin [Acidobacteria bacterium]|nr:antitoxin [Acidobacteriota bacterium]
MTRPAGASRLGSKKEERDDRKIARVFMTGRSQAVRLPKEFRFDTDRVLIRREGRHVVLSPMFKDWDDYLKNGARFTDDFFKAMEELRNTHLPLEEREPFD